MWSVELQPCKLATCLLACLLVLAEIISSTLKMEAICSSDMSVATQQTTRRQIPEDDTLQDHAWLHDAHDDKGANTHHWNTCKTLTLTVQMSYKYHQIQSGS
jgi:hypothetical protein